MPYCNTFTCPSYSKSAVTEATRFGFPAELWCQQKRNLSWLLCRALHSSKKITWLFGFPAGLQCSARRHHLLIWHFFCVLCQETLAFCLEKELHTTDCAEKVELLTDFFHSHGSLVESLVIDKHHVCFLSEGVNLGELIYILGKNTATITVLKYKERCCDEQCPCVRSFFVQFLSCVFS